MTSNEFDEKRDVIFDNVKNYKKDRGWLIGAFNPSILFTEDFEVAIFHMKAGTKTPTHCHLKCVEINIIITGECLVKSGGLKHRLSDEDIFSFPKGVKSSVEYTKDTTLIVIKTPSIPSDKILIENKDDEG